MAQQGQSQLDLMQALIERGLLAQSGNIRSLPFASDTPPSGADGTGIGSTGSPTSASDVPRPEGAMPIIDQQGNLVDPNTGQEPSNASDWWKYLIAGAGVVGGAGLLNALRKRMGSGRVPLVEGEVIDPLAAAPEGAIVDGEYTEAPDTKRIGYNPAIEGDTTVDALTQQKRLNARNRPKANPTASSDTSVVRTGDLRGDLTPEEMNKARSLTEQLIAERMRGNKIRANQTNLTRRGGPPTGPTDEEGLLNTVIRLIREGKIPRSALARGVP